MNEDKALVPEEDKMLKEFLNEDGVPVGLEEIESDDFVIPRLKLLQPTSSEASERKGQAGQIIHTLTGQTYDGSAGIEFVPLFMFKTRVLFDSADRGAGPICRSDNGKESQSGKVCNECSNSKWEAKGNPPECTENYNYPSILLSQSEAPVSISFSRTSMNVGKRMNTYVITQRQPFFFSVWKLTTERESTQKGTFYIFNAQRTRETTKEEREKYGAIFNFLRRRSIKVEDEGTTEAETEDIGIEL